jgi:predicted GTPase
MDELAFIKKRRTTEHHYGDVRKACEKVSVSPTVFQSAIKKTKIDELTDKEMLVISAYKDVLDERISRRESLKSIFIR